MVIIILEKYETSKVVGYIARKEELRLMNPKAYICLPILDRLNPSEDLIELGGAHI